MQFRGKIVFDPRANTKKIENRLESHSYCLLLFDSDICEYYSWFLKKKGLLLIHPVSGPHITLVSEKTKYIDGSSIEEKKLLWEGVKQKYNKLEVEVDINTEIYYSNGKHWWLKMSKESEQECLVIRNLLGLGKPKFSLHFTLGYVNERAENIIQSEYLSKILLDK